MAGVDESAKVKHLIEEMRCAGNLPALSDNIQAICQITDKSNTCAADLSAIILRDCGLTSNILSTANSSVYSPKVPIKTISFAVVFLGFEKVRSLALGLSFFKQTMKSVKDQKLAFLYASSYFSGSFAQTLAREANYSNPEEIFVAGLLYRLPFLALANTYPDMYKRMEEVSEADGISLMAACEKVFGVGYESLCEALASYYNLPERLAKVLKNGQRSQSDPMTKIVRESGHIANMLFGHKQGGKEALQECSERISEILRKQSFAVPDFIKKVCSDDQNIARFFKMDKADVEMMVNALEWGKGNPAQIATQMSAASKRMDETDQRVDDPESLIGHFLTELMLCQRKGVEVNQAITLAQEAIYRCILRSEVFTAFLNRNRTSLIGRFYAGSNMLVKAHDLNVPCTETKSPLIQAVNSGNMVEWRLGKSSDSLFLPGVKRFMLLKSAVVTPISAIRRVIGVHFVGRTDDSVFTDREKIWLEQIAMHVGMCIEKTQDSKGIE